MLHIEGPGLDVFDHPNVNRGRIRSNCVTANSQEDIDDGKGESLVPVDERMVLNEALQQCCGLVNERVVVAGLGTVKGRLECAEVAYAGGATVAFDQMLMEKERISGRDVGSTASAKRTVGLWEFYVNRWCSVVLCRANCNGRSATGSWKYQ